MGQGYNLIKPRSKGVRMAKKLTVMGMIIDRSGVMKDYWKTAKLYESYLKEKHSPRSNPKKLEKIKEALKDTVGSAYESLSRLTKVYVKAAEEVSKELPQETTLNETNSYIAEMKRRTGEMLSIKNEINGETQ